MEGKSYRMAILLGVALLGVAIGVQAVAVWKMYYQAISIDVEWTDGTNESRDFSGSIMAERQWVGAVLDDNIETATRPHIGAREIRLRHGRAEQLVAIPLTIVGALILTKATLFKA